MTLENPLILKISLCDLWFPISEEESGTEGLKRLLLRNTLVPAGCQIDLRDGIVEITLQVVGAEETQVADQQFDEAVAMIDGSSPEAALPILRQLLAFNCYHSDSRIQLARALNLLGRNEEALDEMVEGLRLDPSNGDFYCHAMLNFPESGEMATAEERFARMAIELGTSHPVARIILGRISCEKKSYIEAMEHFEAIPQNSEFGFVRALYCYGKAIIHQARRKFIKAARELEAMFASMRHDTENQLIEICRTEYLACCAEIYRRTWKQSLRLAERELAAIESELGWSIERLEIDPDNEAYWESILWQSLDRPGNLIIQGTKSCLVNPYWIMENACEIRVESGTSRTPGILHLRRKARQIASQVCHEMEIPEGELLDGHVAEDLRRGITNLCANQIYLPIYWLLIHKIVEKHPQTRWPWIIILQSQTEAELECLTGEQESMPSPLSIGIIAMTCSTALFLQHLSSGVLQPPVACREHPCWKRSLAIHDHWRTFIEVGQKPRGEVSLIHEIAALAGFLPDSAPAVQGRLF